MHRPAAASSPESSRLSSHSSARIHDLLYFQLLPFLQEKELCTLEQVIIRKKMFCALKTQWRPWFVNDHLYWPNAALWWVSLVLRKHYTEHCRILGRWQARSACPQMYGVSSSELRELRMTKLFSLKNIANLARNSFQFGSTNGPASSHNCQKVLALKLHTVKLSLCFFPQPYIGYLSHGLSLLCFLFVSETLDTRSVIGERNSRWYNTNNTCNPDNNRRYRSKGPLKREFWNS